MSSSSFARLGLILALTALLTPKGHAEDKWWQFSYEGSALPAKSTPAFALAEPTVKAGMTINDSISDGVLSMTCKGEGANHYYLIGYRGSSEWRPESELGTTLEARVRVAEMPEKFTTVALISTSGYGPDGNRLNAVFFGREQVTALGKSYPLDMTKFHVFRMTYDAPARLFTLYVDGKKLGEMPLDKAGIDPNKSCQIAFGFTYSPMMQGVLEVDYLRWACKGAVAP